MYLGTGAAAVSAILAAPQNTADIPATAVTVGEEMIKLIENESGRYAAFFMAVQDRNTCSSRLIDHLVGAAAAGKSFWFCLKSEPHTEDIAHGLF